MKRLDKKKLIMGKEKEIIGICPFKIERFREGKKGLFPKEGGTGGNGGALQKKA